MSFFGSQPSTTAPTSGTATPSSGFSFGGGGDAGKSLFGATAAKPDAKPFSFTSPTSTPVFGQPGTSAFSTGQTTGTGSLFSAPAATATPVPSFGSIATNKPSFGTPTVTPSGGFAFGQSPGAPPAFGSTQPTFGALQTTGSSLTQAQPVATQASTGFGFGGSTFGQTAPAAQTSAPSTVVPFGQNTSSAFSFSQKTPAFGTQQAATTPAFGAQQPATTPAFGAQQPAPTTQATTGFGGFQAPTHQQNAAPTAFNVSASFTLPKPAFGAPTTGTTFGATATTTAATVPFGTQAAPTATGATFGSQSTTTATVTPFGASPATTGFTAPGGGFGFGAPKPTATTAVAPTPAQTPSFGMAQTGFGATATAAPNSTSFNLAPSSTAGFNLAPASTAPVSSTFGTAPAPQSTASTASTGFNLPAPVTTTATATSSAASAPTTFTAAPKTTASMFGTPPAATTATSGFMSGGILATPASTAATGFNLAPSTTTAAGATTSTSGITPLNSFGKTQAPTTTATTISSQPAATEALKEMNFVQLEEVINKWTLQLEEQEKQFINQATQLNEWDRTLIENGEKIMELNDTIQTLKNSQQGLEHELDFVLGQQSELEELLKPLQENVEKESGNPVHPEREHMYQLAESLDTQLRSMSEDLKEVIEHLNETNRSQDSNDPVVQIGRILNAHMSSMQWIDNSIVQITTKLDQLNSAQDNLERSTNTNLQNISSYR